MSKRLFGILIAILLIVSGGLCYAASPASQNVIYISGSGGQVGITPPTEIIKVRYGLWGANLSGLSSGDVVVWDNVSADGITITKALASNRSAYAGVLVTDVATADNAGVKASDKNWGYMAIRGYCLASIDAAVTAPASLGVANTGGLTTNATDVVSQDVGTLLLSTGGAGRAPVWLH